MRNWNWMAPAADMPGSTDQAYYRVVTYLLEKSAMHKFKQSGN